LDYKPPSKAVEVSEIVSVIVLVLLVLVSCWYVPRVARRIERDAYKLDPQRFGWLHDHVDHVRHEPKPRKREHSDKEGDS
jgi:ABC-type nickel/cobalt efflux system permease component RcnA